MADFAGLTRDRHYGDGRLGEHEFIVIDTGGFEPDSRRGIVKEMAKQTRQAVAEADAVDLRRRRARRPVGAGPRHRPLPAHGRQAVVLAANKAEGMTESPQLAEFYELGLGEPHPVSAAHGQGIRSLVEVALEPPRTCADEDDEDDERRPTRAPIKLAVAGRPNVGKSTLINTWLGEERLVAFDQPGTTRDAITVPFERGGQQVRADRHRRPAPQGQGVRGDREVLGRQDAAGDRTEPTSCCCCSTRRRA